MSQRVRDKAVATATIAIQLATWVDGEFVLPKPKIPDWQSVPPEEAALGLRQNWDVGMDPLPNMVHLLESRGVRVFSLVEECRDLDGLSLWHDSTPYVFLNTTKPAARSRFSAAHELGHLLLHRAFGPSGHRTTEAEANRFASAFLMPRDNIIDSVPKDSTLKELEHHARTWNVSVQALIYRMHEIGMTTRWRYRSLFIGYNRRPLDDSGPGETSKVYRQVFDLLRAQGRDRSDVADAIHLHLEDLHALVFGLVPTILPDDPSPSQVPYDSIPETVTGTGPQLVP